MKNLLKIVLGGWVIFMVLAIAQESSYFAQQWFGYSEPITAMPEPERKAAADTVYEMLTLMEHFYASGGDPRYTERMPASPVVVEEMVADVRYLGRGHRVQEPTLERLEVTAVEPLGRERVEIRTREFWSIRQRHATRRSQAEPARPHMAYATYRLTKDARGWRVDTWDLNEPPAEEEMSSGRKSPHRP